jgi:DNA-binding MarR family transcriptional regulator
MKDHVDWIVEAWARELPGIDTGPIEVVGRLLRASRHLQRGIERQLETLGLNMTEFNVLGALRRTGTPYRMTPAELSRSLLLSSGGLTKRLDRLELEGLIERSPALDDRRSVLVGLTPAGLTVIDEAVAAHLTNEARLIEPLSHEERDALTSILRTLLASFEDRSEPKRRRARRLRPVHRA